MHSACQFHSDKPWLDKQFHDAEQTSIKKPDELIADIKDPNGRIDERLYDRILGSIFGLILGDALGAHVEFRPRDFLVANPVSDLHGGGTWGLAKGQFTDDTSMALCLINSLLARHGFVPYDQLVRYKWWYKHGYMSSTGHCFDIGSATTQSINEFERRQVVFANQNNIPLEQLDYLSDQKLLDEFDVYCSSDGVAGNGALMRLAPVPLFFYHNPKLAVKYSGISGRITHGDQKAYDSCRYFGALIVAAAHGETKDNLLSNRFYDNHKDWFNDEPLHPDVLNVLQGSFKRTGGYDDGIRGKGFIIDALEAALWAFWRDEDSFEKGVLAAVNLGDDTDTTAAIYGSLAGTYYGYKNLNQNWVDSVYAKPFIVCLCKWMTYEISKTSNDEKSMIRTFPNQDSTNHHDSEMQQVVIEKPLKTHHDPPIIISTPTKIPYIQCTANDHSGHLGSFYDGYRDRLIVQSDITVKNQQISVTTKTMECFVRQGNSRENLNLLQMINVTNELRLSLELNMTSPLGITKAMNYSFPIDAHTRFLYYNYLDREELLVGNADDVRRSILSPTPKTEATHVITGVNWGIEVLAILQLSSSDASLIDGLLKRLRQCLADNNNEFNTTRDEKRLLDQINRTTIYSNINELTKINKVLDLYEKISDLRQNRSRHLPLTYKLSPIRMIFPEYSENDSIYTPLEPQIIDKVELYLQSVSFQFKTLRELLGRKAFHSSDESLRQQFLDAQRQFSDLEAIYNQEIKTLEDWIINARKGKISRNATLPELTDSHQNALKESINKIINHLHNLTKRHETNIQRQKKGNENNENSKHSIHSPEEKPDDSSPIVDTRETNHDALATDIDYSIRMCIEYDPSLDDDSKVVYEPGTKTSWPSRTYSEISKAVSADEIINILLLGEVGVGKSTFINAFANYYSFKTLDSAEVFDPVVVAPSSFPVTTHDWSAKPIYVRVGTPDSNEVHPSYEHSTTQQCKSYLFQMYDGTYIRFIDTPGLGELTNSKQNSLQMNSILSFINNLPHLNAVCFLLKPNFSRFFVYESSFQRLFDFLGENITRNIIFCFTHSFSTRFNSNDGIHLFETALESIATHRIRIREDNTFHFDSESFRYLAASKYSIDFNTESMYRIKSSWSKSKYESIRFIRYIKTSLSPVQLHRECLSIDHAQLQIQSMIRPIMETMRNMLRNYVLSTRDSSDVSIELCPKPARQRTAHCVLCKSYCNPVGKFWILADRSHRITANRCHSCVCSLKHHIKMDYQLDHKASSDRYANSYNGMADILELIKFAAYLAYFLQWSSNDSQHDPFLCSINRMLNEENFVCLHYSSSNLNRDLHFTLEDLKQHYYQEFQELSYRKPKSYNFDLHRINEKINSINTFPMISEQMNAIKQTRELFMMENDHKISINEER